MTNGQRARYEMVSERIVEQAVGLFADKGYEGTGIGDIAEAMDMSRPSFYHYFESKEALLEKVLEGYTGEVTAYLRDVRNDATSSPSEKLALAISGLARRVAAKPAHLRLLAGSENSFPPRLARAHKHARHEAFEHVVSILREGVEAGQLRPVDEEITALALFGMCHWIAWWYRPDGPATVDQIADEMANLMLSGLVRPESRRQASGIHHAMSLLREDLDYLQRFVGPSPPGS